MARILALVLCFTLTMSCSPRVLMQPRWVIDAGFAWRKHDVLWYVETDQRRVALTIDDTPDSLTTPAILDVLEENDAHATFFVIGKQASGHADLLRRIVREGHELGNHGMQDRPSVSLTRRAFELDLLATEEILNDYAQGPTRWFRPGSGWYDEPILKTLERHGYRCVLGDVYPLDGKLQTTGLAQSMIRWMVRPGSIIILHDREDRGLRTAAILRRLLPELEKQGYEVVTLSELAFSATTPASVRTTPRPSREADLYWRPSTDTSRERLRRME